MTVPEERIGYSSADKAEGELAEEPGASEGGPRLQRARVGEVLEWATAWARRRPDIRGLAPVGSWVRGSARTDSDVDLVVPATDPGVPRLDGQGRHRAPAA